MSRTVAPRRRQMNRRPIDDLDDLDVALVFGYHGDRFKALTEERQLDVLLVPHGELERQWSQRRDRLIADAVERGWPRPLAGEFWFDRAVRKPEVNR